MANPFGMYSCLKCSEYAVGNSGDLQDFIAEHMCECTNAAKKTERLNQCIAILQQNIPRTTSLPLQQQHQQPGNLTFGIMFEFIFNELLLYINKNRVFKKVFHNISTISPEET